MSHSKRSRQRVVLSLIGVAVLTASAVSYFAIAGHAPHDRPQVQHENAVDGSHSRSALTPASRRAIDLRGVSVRQHSSKGAVTAAVRSTSHRVLAVRTTSLDDRGDKIEVWMAYGDTQRGERALGGMEPVTVRWANGAWLEESATAGSHATAPRVYAPTSRYASTDGWTRVVH